MDYLERLNEALEGEGPASDEDAAVVVAAARAFRDFLANGEGVLIDPLKEEE